MQASALANSPHSSLFNWQSAEKMSLAPSPFPAFPNQIWHCDSQRETFFAPSLSNSGSRAGPASTVALCNRASLCRSTHDCQHSLSQTLLLKELLCLSIKHLIFFTFHNLSICFFFCCDSRDPIFGSTSVFLYLHTLQTQIHSLCSGALQWTARWQVLLTSHLNVRFLL